MLKMYLIAKISTENMLWVGGISGILLLGGGIAFWIIRKKFHSVDDPNQSALDDAPFTLEQVRQLHSRGQISDDEFEKLKTKILRQTNPD